MIIVPIMLGVCVIVILAMCASNACDALEERFARTETVLSYKDKDGNRHYVLACYNDSEAGSVLDAQRRSEAGLRLGRRYLASGVEFYDSKCRTNLYLNGISTSYPLDALGFELMNEQGKKLPLFFIDFMQWKQRLEIRKVSKRKAAMLMHRVAV